MDELKHAIERGYSTEPDTKQLSVCKEEWTSSLDQEEKELPHIKVEPEEQWTSQEGEHLQGLNETDIKVTNIVSIKSESDYKEEPSPQPVSSDQRETETEDRDDDWKEPGLITLKTEKTWRMEDARLVCKEEWSPSLDQEEPEPPHIKVEQEELWTSQEGEQLEGLTETDIKITNIVSLMSESDYRETPSPQPVSSDQNEVKTKDGDDDWKEPGLITLKTRRRRKKGSVSITAGEDRSLHSSLISQPIATSSKPNRARSHCCQECGRSFCRLANLKRHQRVHTGEKHFHCHKCGKSFNNRSMLKRHQRVHTVENPYHCQQCGKIFIQLSTLQRHERVHTGEKPYHCQQCGKSFSQSSLFYQHQHVHTGGKPYHCQQCGKNFNDLAKYRIHIRVHTGEKPYHCQQCGKSFSLLGNLNTHLHIHTGEKPFLCHQCGKSFREMSKLNRHQHVHTGDKPYHCQQCGRSFSQSGNIKRHKCIHAGKDI